MNLSEYLSSPGALAVGELRKRSGVPSDAQIRQWQHGYLRAGEVLEACGQDRAKADAAARACFAEARNGYRDSKECEAMP